MCASLDPRSGLPSQAPVVVVGGGYAGLSAVLTLRDNGVAAFLLEGSDRVGGRTWSQRTPERVLIDHGGQWVGPRQHRLLALAQRFGCATFPTWESGVSLESWSDGTIRSYTGSGPEEAPGMGTYKAVGDRIDELAQGIDLDNPAAHELAREWDSETVQSYFQRTVPSVDARARLDLAVQGVWSVEPREISLLHLLFYVASAGGFDQLMDTRGAAQDSRFVAGAQAPARAVAEYLDGAIAFDAEVQAIECAGATVSVHTMRGAVRTERVIVTTPPPATAAIRFQPTLPVPRMRWLQRSVMGDVAKVHACYSRAFWRDADLSGIATVYGNDPVSVVFDNSPPDAEVGVLVAFVYGDRLRRWSALPASERRRSVLETLERLFGEEASRPLEYAEKIWPEDRWAGGGYAANPTPGAWIAHSQGGWRTPCGPIHWAGTETASVWNGYIDGAISSGERAAREVLAAMRGREGSR